MFKLFKHHKKDVLSFDIGFDIIKAIYIYYENNSLKGKAICKRFSKKNNILTDSNYYFKNYYNSCKDEISLALLSIIDELGIDENEIEIIASFNSLYAEIFTRKFEAPSKKRLHYSADTILEKITSEKNIAKYKIINFNRKNNKGEVLFYSFDKSEYSDFLHILNNLPFKINNIQFDLLSLANLVNYTNSEDVVLEIGLTKTILVQVRNGLLIKSKVFPFGSFEIFNRIGNRLHLKFEEIIELNKNKKLHKLLSISDIKYSTIYDSYLSRIHKELEIYFNGKIPQLTLSGGILQWLNFTDCFNNAFKQEILIMRELNFFENIIHNDKEETNYNIALGQILEYV